MTTRTLHSGTIVDVDERGRATPLRCTWLIEVASGNPEPDSYADTVTTIECGHVLKAVPGYDFETTGAHTCSGGHSYFGLEAELGSGGREWEREMRDRG